MGAGRSLRAALVAVLAAYLVVLLVLPGVLPDWVRDLVLAQVSCVLAATVLLHRARAVPDQRAWLLALALAVGTFVLGGNLAILVPEVTGRSVPVVLTDGTYLAIYPCLLAGLFLGLRHRLSRVRLIVTFDGVTGALAGAAVTAYAVVPLLGRDWAATDRAEVSAVFLVGDVMLVSAFLGALSLLGVRNGRHFALCGFGVLLFGVGDIVYAYLLAFDAYRVGTVADGLWICGLALIALGATAATPQERDTVPATGSLTVVAAASVAAVAVLAVAPDWGTSPLPSLLAILTLASAGVRLALAFRQLHELAVVRQQALTDELTGVGNRRALYHRLDELLGGPGDAVADPRSFSLALVDLDHFKEVNDSFGHGTGDELLQRVAGRFADTLTELGVPHLLTRLGADEFAVVLDGVASANAALGCGVALQESLEAPVVLQGVELHVRASIGIALAPEHARSRSDMLFAADAAMYVGKSSGEPVSLFSPAVAGDRRNRLEVAEDLYAALERHELFVEYQPQVSTTGGIVGAEALVRWQHPTRGRLMPDEFLPVAERYRLTPDIAQRVLDVALTDLRAWRVDRPDLGVSVNVSATDLQNERLVDLVAAALLEHGVPPAALTIEITETALMRDPEVAQSTLHALDALGVRLAVDDYGTGYSSLEYLLKLPIDEIKLDRAFSCDLANEQRSVAIVRSTIDLTHALGLHMVAEGVEDAETLTVLRGLGCDLVQGWHLGRPTSSADFLRLVTTSPARLRS